MEYRTFNKTGEKISLFGFGTMRMPVHEDGSLNHEESVRMIRHAIDKGCNYVDTAYMYHKGESEVAVGEALKGTYRYKVFLADKMPVWLAKDEEQMKKIFFEQLDRLKTDHIDFYLVHNITVPIWARAKKFNLMDFLLKQQKEGRIKHIGFSFHDEVDFFCQVLEEFPWDFCQIQFNYMDTHFQAGLKGLMKAASMNIPVIVMEPLKGGKLADKVPAGIMKEFAKSEVKRTPASWALRWVANFPEVLTILNGVHSYNQLEENLATLSDARENALTIEEKHLIDNVATKYRKMEVYPCTDCKYCLPCTVKLDIPTIIDLYNQYHLYEKSEKIQADYDLWFGEKRRASKCTACGQCEEQCPQHLPIIEIMKKASEVFDK